MKWNILQTRANDERLGKVWLIDKVEIKGRERASLCVKRDGCGLLSFGRGE